MLTPLLTRALACGRLDTAPAHQIVELLALALQPSGLLLLGKAEGVGLGATMTSSPRERDERTTHLIKDVVLARLAQASVVLNRRFEILYFFGPSQDFLEPPAGAARLDVLAWAPPALYPKLMVALDEAVERRADRTFNGTVERGGALQQVECTVSPLGGPPELDGLLLVSFRQLPSTPLAKADVPEADRPFVRQLEQDLESTRRQLKDVVRQLEASSEAYRVSHDDLLALNEQLRASNEELESSKEELHALNEELTRVNRQLEERNEHHRALHQDLDSLLASAELPAIFLDRDLRIRRFTPASAGVAHLADGDLGRLFAHIKPRFVDDALLSDAAAVLEGGRSREREIRTDEGRWYVRRVLPYRRDGHDANVEGVCLTFHEFTTQKRAIEAIDEARLLSESIVRTLRTPLLILDEELRVVTANDCFYEAFHLEKQGALGRHLDQLVDGRWDTPAFAELFRALAHKESVKDLKVDAEVAGVGRRCLRVNASVMLREGRPDHLLLSLEDVTSRTEAEAVATQRTQELEAEHQRKDEFLAMLGHELRNPLAAVVHGLDLLGAVAADRTKAEEVRGMLVRQTTRMRTLLDQLLDMARVVSGNIVLTSCPVDLRDVVEAGLETVRPLLESQRHELTVVLPPPGAVRVLGDLTRLAQVVENLLTNAAKYTDPGGHLWVAVDASPDEAHLRVKDSGRGLEPDEADHIFDLFTQGKRPLDRAQGGLGLGLPLVRRLVEMHGGTVAAHSSGVGHGTTVTVRLRRLPNVDAPASTKAAEAAPASTSAAPVGPPAPARRRVLVVDDEEDNATLFTRLLEAQGHQARAAHEGETALRAVTELEPEIVFLDLGLPGQNGYEVARRIRDEHPDRPLMLVALTGYQRDQAQLDAAGFDEHLIKPPDLDVLRRILETAPPVPRASAS